jgi:tRNA-specific 2-thiouridylase
MRIAVAMSGGVDSAVAALLLRREGHDVVALSMQLLDASEGGRIGRCCSGDDLEDARRAAWSVGILHFVLDFEETFRREVREPFVRSWLAGETPVPCLECNTRVKFGPLLDKARALGCERLATGHYARIVDGPDGLPRLARATDLDKDQSWFLWELPPETLRSVLFPLGERTKAETRRIAREAGLSVAEKPESQEICFVPPGTNHADLVDREAPPGGPLRAGSFVDREGRILGHHAGFHRFTVGQRKGLGIGFGERTFVLEVRPGSGEVVLGPPEGLLVDRLDLRQVRWFGPAGGSRCQARIRSRGGEEPALFELGSEAGVARVRFDRPVRRSAPGQPLVAYGDGGMVLGGGRIAPDRSGSNPATGG